MYFKCVCVCACARVKEISGQPRWGLLGGWRKQFLETKYNNKKLLISQCLYWCVNQLATSQALDQHLDAWNAAVPTHHQDCSRSS